MEIVLVDWVDSAMSSGWRPRESNFLTPAVCQSVGFVVRQTPTELLLCMSINEEEWAEMLVIPWANIRKMTTLTTEQNLGSVLGDVA